MSAALASTDATWLAKHDAEVRADERKRAVAEWQAQESPTWPWVACFARLMERKLDANRHKGNRDGWLNDPASSLLKRLDEEVAELWHAYRTGRISEMPDEAADVANFAMMIADVVGGLDGTLGVRALAQPKETP